MWLSSSSVGRKFIMALTGACLVLFVTFHCLMNAIAICWPTAYNMICMFLGANWYALVASAGLAVLIILHIIYAIILTLQNRKARGTERYSMSRRPKSVEWSSQNMFVLGVVILAFLVVHLIQFWAKMQLVEVVGIEGEIPPTAGTLFIQEAFSQIWTPIVYIIGFIALWFHMNHGFWSMFQSVGWDNTTWIPRLKKISAWWVSIVIALFVCQAVVFTVKSKEGFYKTDEALRGQYMEMLAENVAEDLGMPAEQLAQQISSMPMEQLAGVIQSNLMQIENQLKMMEAPENQAMLAGQPGMKEQTENMKKAAKAFGTINRFLIYLDPKLANTQDPMQQMMQQQMQQVPQQAAPQEEVETVEEVKEEAAATTAPNADEAPAQENNPDKK